MVTFLIIIIGILVLGITLIIYSSVDDIVKQRERSMSFRESINLLGMPLVTFENDGKILTFLLDTGSNSNIIDSNIIEQIAHNPIDNKSECCGIEGNKSIQNMCIIEISYKNQKFMDEFVIRDMSGPFGIIKKQRGFSVNGILGSNFFNKYKYMLDFNEMTAYTAKG